MKKRVRERIVNVREKSGKILEKEEEERRKGREHKRIRRGVE